MPGDDNLKLDIAHSFHAGFNEGRLADSLVSRVEGQKGLLHSVWLILICHPSLWVIWDPLYIPVPHVPGATPPLLIFCGQLRLQWATELLAIICKKNK